MGKFNDLTIANGEMKNARTELFLNTSGPANTPDDFEATKNLCEKFLDAFYTVQSITNGNDRIEKTS